VVGNCTVPAVSGGARGFALQALRAHTPVCLVKRPVQADQA
jgi:hypothetical protein